MIKLTQLILTEQAVDLFKGPKKAAKAVGKKAKKAGASVFDKLKNIWSRTAKTGAGKTDEERAQEWDQIKNKINAFFTDFMIKPNEDDFQKWINKNTYKLTPQNATKLLAQQFIGGIKQISLSKEILKKLGDEFKFFSDMEAEQYVKIMKRSLGVAAGNEQALREYFLKFVNENLDSLLGETEDDASQVSVKASKAIGIPMKDVGKKVGNTEMIAQMMTEYDQLFSKIPKKIKDDFIKSVKDADVKTAAEALLQLLVKNVKFMDKDKTKGDDPLGQNVKLLTKILGLDAEEIKKVLSQALSNINVNELPGLTQGNEVRDGLVRDLIRFEKKWEPQEEQLKQIIDKLLEKYDDEKELTDDDKQEILNAAIQQMAPKTKQQ
jgi:hypothetical protein